MSLVVAQATDAGPRIVSDTRVTLPDGPGRNPKTGTLKAVVAARDVTVCFAGDLVPGLEGVRGFARELDKGRAVDDFLPRLQELTSDRRRTVEFIVAKAEGELRSQLVRIRNGGIEPGLHSAWIGDQAAFERFQRERNRPLTSFESELASFLSAPQRVLDTLRRALEVVIADPAIDSVGGFCVSVALHADGFRYLESTFIHVGRDIVVHGGADLISRMAQSVEEGGYQVSVVEPAEPGIPALGLNFPRARLGMLYLPLQFDAAEVISDVSPNDFASVVRQRFGVAMKDPMLRYG